MHMCRIHLPQAHLVPLNRSARRLANPCGLRRASAHVCRATSHGHPAGPAAATLLQASWCPRGRTKVTPIAPLGLGAWHCPTPRFACTCPAAAHPQRTQQAAATPPRTPTFPLLSYTVAHRPTTHAPTAARPGRCTASLLLTWPPATLSSRPPPSGRPTCSSAACRQTGCRCTISMRRPQKWVTAVTAEGPAEHGQTAAG